MKPEEAKAKAKADAIAAGKSEAEAELMGDVAFHKTEAEFFKGEAKAAFGERDTAAAKIKELQGSNMTDVEKMRARLAELEPTAAEAVALKAKLATADGTIQKLFDIELQSIPEDRRKHVPEGLPVADRLVWLRQAKADGVFGQQTASQGAEIGGGGNGTTMKRDRFDLLVPSARMKFMQQGGQIVD